MIDPTIAYVLIVINAIGIIAGVSSWSARTRVISQLRADRNAWMQSAETHAAARREVEPREALFRKALGFYARDTHWRPMRTRRHSITFRDRGAVARAALRGEDIDQVMQQLHLAQAAPPKAAETPPGTPDAAPAATQPEHAQAA